MNYYVVEPEVAGAWGENTEADTSVHPPVVHKLHYHIDCWNRVDCILESFPIFIITESAANKLTLSEMTGFTLDDVEISFDDDYRDMHPPIDRAGYPNFKWLKVIGTALQDDFGIAQDLRLVLSETALTLLQSCGLEHADIEKL